MNEEILNRLTNRTPRQRIGNAIGRFGALATGHAPSDNTDALDRMIKYNQLQTGSPEFKMREAQTRADIELQKGLDLERAKKAQAQAEYEAALAGEGGGSQQIIQPSTVRTSENVPLNMSTSMPSPMPQTGGVPKFITNQEPAIREYDEKIGKFITKPGKSSSVKNPDYQGAMTGNAGQYAGSIQGLKAIEDIHKILGLQREPSGKVSFMDEGKAKADILGSKAAGFRAKLPLGLGGFLPGAEELATGVVQSFAGEDARNLDLAYQTLAEDVLRARTGAAAPEPEQVRELARTFARFQDTPENIYKRLEQNGIFLETAANSMKPEGQISRPNIPDKYQVGQVVPKNGKTYTYLGNDKWQES